MQVHIEFVDGAPQRQKQGECGVGTDCAIERGKPSAQARRTRLRVQSIKLRQAHQRISQRLPPRTQRQNFCTSFTLPGGLVLT